jgi:hypothetical protein
MRQIKQARFEQTSLPKNQGIREVATLDSRCLVSVPFRFSAMHGGFAPTMIWPTETSLVPIGSEEAEDKKKSFVALRKAEVCDKEASLVKLLQSDPDMCRRVAMAVDRETAAEWAKARSDAEMSADSLAAECTPMPTRKQFLQLHVQSAVPFIGFGFFDNMIMLTVGGAIENTIGVSLCLTSLAAAGMGQMVSDACGITLQGLIERFSDQLGLPRPNLTAQQRNMKCVQTFILASRIFGIVFGCCLGMFPLLIMPDTPED